jgi:nicotinamidase-related amidase
VSKFESQQSSDRKALLLIDFQCDFLAESGRMPVARHQIEPVIAAANKAVVDANTNGADVVAIGNEFSPSDRLMNLVRRGAAIAGSSGARWDARVPIAGATYFPKWRSDAFCNPALSRFLQERGIGEVILAGLFARACVTATAKGALARGLKVSILRDAVADASNRAREAALNHLARCGVRVYPAYRTD